MTDSMVEKVALALYAREKVRADKADSIISEASRKAVGSTMEPWEEVRDIFMDDARAAIVAMRTPTETMKWRMGDNLEAQYRDSDWEEAKDVAEGLNVEWIWMRGIDAALSEDQGT